MSGIWNWVIRIAQILARGRDEGVWKEGQGPAGIRDPRDGPK